MKLDTFTSCVLTQAELGATGCQARLEDQNGSPLLGGSELRHGGEVKWLIW